jgi:hypothetical protein
MLVLFVAELFLQKNLLLVLAVGLVNGFSVATGAVVELLILTWKFWKEGFAIGNLYARLSTYILILIPGLVMVAVPMVGALVAYLLYPTWALIVFLGIAGSEFAAVTLVSLRQH